MDNLIFVAFHAVQVFGLFDAAIGAGAKIGCSEDQLSLNRIPQTRLSVSNWVPPCFSGRPSGERTGRRISTGALSRTGALDERSGGAASCAISRRDQFFARAEAWRRAIEVFDEDAGAPRSLSLFPEDRCDAPVLDATSCRSAAQRDAAAPAAPVGRLLAGRRSVATSCDSTASGPQRLPANPRRDALGSTCCKMLATIG